MMFREGVAGITTLLTVDVSACSNLAGLIVAKLGSGQSSGQRPEQHNKKKYLHFRPSIT